MLHELLPDEVEVERRAVRSAPSRNPRRAFAEVAAQTSAKRVGNGRAISSLTELKSFGSRLRCPTRVPLGSSSR